jgi:hypothetical protein
LKQHPEHEGKEGRFSDPVNVNGGNTKTQDEQTSPESYSLRDAQQRYYSSNIFLKRDSFHNEGKPARVQ